MSRRGLLLGTALTSFAVLGGVPSPVQAQETCVGDVGTGPIPISRSPADSIECFNTEARTADGSPAGENVAIELLTAGDGFSILLDSEGRLQASDGGAVAGIFTTTIGALSPITVRNRGDIDRVVSTGDDARGILGFTIYSPISITNSGDGRIEAGANAYGIDATTGGDASESSNVIAIDNSGDFDVTAGGDGFGIKASAFGFATDNSYTQVTIKNSGDLSVDSEANGFAIDAAAIFGDATDSNVGVKIDNSGNVDVDTSDMGVGIRAYTFGNAGGNSTGSVGIENSGDFWVKSSGQNADAYGIHAKTMAVNRAISVDNSGDFSIESAADDRGTSIGIFAAAYFENSDVHVANSGDFSIKSTNGDAVGIMGQTGSGYSTVWIDNHGDFRVASGARSAIGIEASVRAGATDPVGIHNTGDIWAEGPRAARGLYVNHSSQDLPALIWNSGDVSAHAMERDGTALYVRVRGGPNSPVEIGNSGDLRASTAADNAFASGIAARVFGSSAKVEVRNSGKVAAANPNGSADGISISAYEYASPTTISSTGDMAAVGATASGISASTFSHSSPLRIANGGDLTARGHSRAYGIRAGTDTLNSGPDSDGSPLTIHNSGRLDAKGTDGAAGIHALSGGHESPIVIKNSGEAWGEVTDAATGRAGGIHAEASGENSPISIHNSGSAYAKGGMHNAGIATMAAYASSPTTIVNTGDISAQSYRAIHVDGYGSATVHNAGRITGFVKLTDQDDAFENQSGGVFETKLTSLFGAGDDLFHNKSGGTVLAATDPNTSEKNFFEGLETFKNGGLISMVDGRPGDRFTISNTPGGTDLDFKAWGNSTLAVDAFLGGPRSKSDTFTVEGDVSGTTKVDVRNTNPGPGVFNSAGIPVVFVDGATPSAGNFRLKDGPIDTGFFDYDLFFEKTNSGFWELRSFPGAGAHLLPQLLTAAQDIWHQSSATWFDRTADLRVILNAPSSVPAGDKSLVAPVPNQLTPAAWLKTGGQWLDRDANARTRAYGRTYNYNLDRELESFDLQAGVDFGSRDVMNPGDALVFGVLGGFVYGDLSYDNIARNFDYSGGQVGVYGTYLNGGLFVDTLVNVHIYDLDTSTRGFPNSIDGNTVGLRTDTGYRFGSFDGGMFIEPLATIEVMWVDLDGFTNGGNRVSFDDEANVRGRLGLRAGTTGQFMQNVLWEPFVIGSVWGNLSDDNTATLVSTGRTFRFVDDPEDVWGEVSAGVNFFNFSQTTSVFGKVDVSFGDDLTGVGGQGGMRVVW